MPPMFVTLLVSNDERSKDVRALQPSNMLYILATLPVLKDERLNSVKALQS